MTLEEVHIAVNANSGSSIKNHSAVPEEGRAFRLLQEKRLLHYLLWAFALFHLGKQQETREWEEALPVDLQQPPGSYSLSGSSIKWTCLFLSPLRGIQVCDPPALHASLYDWIDQSWGKNLRSTATPNKPHCPSTFDQSLKQIVSPKETSLELIQIPYIDYLAASYTWLIIKAERKNVFRSSVLEVAGSNY